MHKIIPRPIAAYSAALLLLATALLHLLLLSGQLPKDLVWGGNAAADNKFYAAEMFALLLTLWFAFVVLAFAGKITTRLRFKFLRRWLWIMTIFFLMNTLGNLMADHHFEQWVLAPVTLLLSLFCFVLAMGPPLVPVPEPVNPENIP